MPIEPSDPNLPPVEPSAGTSPSFETSSTAPTSTGMAPNTAAGCSVILGLITGIVFLVIEKRNGFVRFWAMQATLFGLVGVVFNVVIRILIGIFSASNALLSLIGLLSTLVGLVLIVFWIIMLIKAFGGKEYELPFIGKIARQQLRKFPAS